MSNAYLDAQSRPRNTVVCAFRRTKMVEPKLRLTVTVELVSLGGQKPYFSVTAEERNLRRRGDNQIEACGCLHEEVLKHWPDLQFVVDMHLSDADGAPMHAVANMAYWLGFAQHAGDLKIAAKHWRITETEAQALRNVVVARMEGQEGKRYDLAQQILTEIVAEEYAAQWATDAAQTKAFIESEHARMVP